MYPYDAVPDAVAQVDELPVSALPAYAELIVFLELTPWEGTPYRDDKPDGSAYRRSYGPASSGRDSMVATILVQSPSGGISPTAAAARSASP